jgi:polygalacturonase
MPRNNLIILIVLLVSQYAGSALGQDYNIRDFGAIGDGSTVNTVFIQKAIDRCADMGGGRVYVPAGVFITGTIHLKTNVNLYLESGATIKGSSQLRDYLSYTMPEYGQNYYGMLYTHNAENVSITGFGAIEGNDSAFFDFQHAKTISSRGSRFTRQKDNYRKSDVQPGDGPVVPKDRPHQMVIFTACHHVNIANVSLLHSPFWTLHFMDCDNVTVANICLWSGLLIPNGDGIDVTSCSNVLISGCDIRTGDDAVVVGGYNHHFEIPGFNYATRVCENIIVTDCNLQSASSAIRVGFLDQNDVRHVHFSHINITNSTRGIGIFLRDQGSIDDISFEDIFVDTKMRTGDWWGNGEPIHISAVRGKDSVKLGHIRNVRFRDVNCRGENGILLYGSENSVLQDISFENVNVQILNSMLNSVAGGNIDLRGCLDEKEQLFASDLPGFYARYVDNLSINHVTVSWDSSILQPFFTNGLQVDHFHTLSVHGFKGSQAPHSEHAYSVLLRDGEEVETDSDAGFHMEDVSHIKAGHD